MKKFCLALFAFVFFAPLASGEPITGKSSPEFWQAEAREAIGNKDFPRAITAYDYLIKLNPQNSDYYFLRGNLHFDSRQFDLALSDFSKGIEIRPTFNLYYNRALTYGNLQQYEKAVEDYGQTLTFNTKDPNVYYYRGNSYLLLGEYKKAIDDFNKAISLKPDFAEAYYNRAILYRAMGQNQKAIDSYLKFLEYANPEKMGSEITLAKMRILELYK